MDNDDDEKQIFNRIDRPNGGTIKCLRLPDVAQDLSEYFNIKNCKKTDILSLIEKTNPLNIEKLGKAKIFDLLSESNEILSLHPAQDFKHNKLWYSTETKDGLLLINSKKETFLIKEIEKDKLEEQKDNKEGNINVSVESEDVVSKEKEE